MSERTRYILAGTVAGAVIGLAAALIAADAVAERRLLTAEGNTKLAAAPRTRDWIKFGVSAVALLRLFSDIISPD